MPIKQTTPQQEIDAYIAQQVKRIEYTIVRSLKYVGERCLTVARESKSYRDITGNLRSSVGYVLSIDGVVEYKSDFSVVKNGGSGSQEGYNFACSLASQFPQGICLIIVAGKNYAVYVSAKGKDVLDSAELLAKQLVPKMLSKLKLKNGKDIKTDSR